MVHVWSLLKCCTLISHVTCLRPRSTPPPLRASKVSVWSLKAPRAPSWHCTDARFYAHTTTSMHGKSIPHPIPPHLPTPPPVHHRIFRGLGASDADGDWSEGGRIAGADFPRELVARPRGDIPDGGGNLAPTIAAEPARISPRQGRIFLGSDDRAPPQGQRQADVM